MSDTQQIGRLAMRHEGTWWNAYYALPGTMEGSFLLGSIQMRFVQQTERRDAFLALMKEALADLMEERLGHRPDMREQPAPESERSGHA